MRRPWNIIDVPVYSLATYLDDKVNMNICTYVTAVSMKPKQYAIAIYYDTKTLENAEKTDKAVLQVLSKSNIGLVKHLGKKTGLKIDKDHFLRSKDQLMSWNNYEVLHSLSALVELKKLRTINTKGDHELFLYEAKRFKTLEDSNVLTYQKLIEEKVIL